MLARLLQHLRPRNDHFDREATAYRRVRELGYAPSALIDVGAYEGHWTRSARAIFGAVPTIMIEPQAAKHAALEALARELPQTRLIPEVLAARAGEEVTFYEMETGSSLMPERSDAPRREVRLTTSTLDTFAPATPNCFLKIDAQGAELEILAGGEAVLRQASLVQLEASVAHYNEGAPTLREVLSFMDERGFVMFDLAGRSRIQGYLVQLDVLFVPRGSPLQRDFFHFSPS